MSNDLMGVIGETQCQLDEARAEVRRLKGTVTRNGKAIASLDDEVERLKVALETERESCARECEGKAKRLRAMDCAATKVRPGVVEMALECADAIRARTSEMTSTMDATPKEQ